VSEEGGKKKIVEYKNERKKKGDEGMDPFPIYPALNKAFNFCLLMRTYHAAAMSLCPGNEIILEIISQNDPFS